MSTDLQRLLRTAHVDDEESLDALARELVRRGYPREREAGAWDSLINAGLVVQLEPRQAMPRPEPVKGRSSVVFECYVDTGD